MLGRRVKKAHADGAAKATKTLTPLHTGLPTHRFARVELSVNFSILIMQLALAMQAKSTVSILLE